MGELAVVICSTRDHRRHKWLENYLVELNQSLVFALEIVLVADTVTMTALTSTSIGQVFDKSSIKPTNALFTGSEP